MPRLVFRNRTTGKIVHLIQRHKDLIQVEYDTSKRTAWFYLEQFNNNFIRLDYRYKTVLDNKVVYIIKRTRNRIYVQYEETGVKESFRKGDFIQLFKKDK